MKKKVILVFLTILCFLGIYLILIRDEMSIHRYGFRNEETRILPDAPVFTCNLDEDNKLIISHPEKAYPDILGPKERMLRITLNDVINISASVVKTGKTSDEELDESEKIQWLFSLSEKQVSNLYMRSTVSGGTSIYRSTNDGGHFSKIEFQGEYSGTIVLYNGQDEYAFIPMNWTDISEVANRGLFRIDKLIIAFVMTIIIVGLGVCIRMTSNKGSQVLTLYMLTVVIVIFLAFFVCAFLEGIFWRWESLPSKVIL